MCGVHSCARAYNGVWCVSGSFAIAWSSALSALFDVDVY
jgi:hypothetical protein